MAELFKSGAVVGVTGANGFIGSAVRKALEIAGADFFVVEGDIREPDTFDRDFDILIHLAARTPAARDSNVVESISINVSGTAQALEACRKRNASIVFASSSGIYRPRSEKIPLDEHSPVGPTWLYPQTKRLGELLCLHYSEAHGVRSRILRLFNVYGPGQPGFFLVAYLIQCALTGETARVRNRYSVRDWIHVDDVADAVVRAAALDGETGIFNIGTGVPTEMEMMMKLLAATEAGSGFECDLQNQGTDPTPVVFADIRAARMTLDWEPRRSLVDGLSDCVRYAHSGTDENRS
jgi:GDP-4-dehydro-6-deoxy-D-mannose reductase